MATESTKVTTPKYNLSNAANMFGPSSTVAIGSDGAVKPVTPVTPVAATAAPPIIPATRIATAPLVIPPPVSNSTAQARLNTMMSSYNPPESATPTGKAPADTAVPTLSPRDQLLEQMMQLFEVQGTQGDREADVYEQEGVFEKQKQVTQLENRLRAAQLAQTRRIEAMEENKEGKFGGALQQDIDKYMRDSNRELADISIQYQAASGNYSDAVAIAKAKIDSEFEPIKNQLDTLKSLYSLYQNDLSDSEKIQLQSTINAQEADAKTLRDTKANLVAMAAQNNAPGEIISGITNAQSVEQAYLTAGQYGRDPLRELQEQSLRASIDNTYSMIRERNANAAAALAANQPINVANLTDPNKPAYSNNLSVLSEIFKSSKIQASNKTTIGNGISLMQAAADLAANNSEGKFTGLYPGRSVVDFLTPNAWKRQKTVDNEALISALDLQTQFWASGATLTEAQTGKVQQMIPNKGDTDAQVRTKTNQLVNYMLSQTAAKLVTDGIQFTPQQVNLYEVADLLKQASPEQIEQLRAQGLIK